MTRYVLDSRSHVRDRIPLRESAWITFQAGILVLFRAGLLLVALYLLSKYGEIGRASCRERV